MTHQPGVYMPLRALFLVAYKKTKVQISCFLSHLLIARCDIGVQLSVRSFVRSSVRPSTIYVKVLTL